jgi:hypothetical protein
VVTEPGWYTFRHIFRNHNGVLAVDLVLLKPNGSVQKTWTLSDPSDVIESVGGNRYGGFFRNEFPVLAIDDSVRMS